MEPATPSPFLSIAFIALTLAVCALLVFGVWRAFGGTQSRAPLVFTLSLGAWLAITAAVASAGLLSDFSKQPPRIFLIVFSGVALSLVIALGTIGRRAIDTLPLWALVGLQGFRFPLELLLHRAYDEGVMPIQMSFSGRNFDIVSGITALLAAFLIHQKRFPTWALHAWNALGFGLLLNIVAIAILSFPTPFRAFHNAPANTWVTHAPFIWLPAVLVMTALLGHVVVLRAALRRGLNHGEIRQTA